MLIKGLQSTLNRQSSKEKTSYRRSGGGMWVVGSPHTSEIPDELCNNEVRPPQYPSALSTLVILWLVCLKLIQVIRGKKVKVSRDVTRRPSHNQTDVVVVFLSRMGRRCCIHDECRRNVSRKKNIRKYGGERQRALHPRFSPPPPGRLYTLDAHALPALHSRA